MTDRAHVIRGKYQAARFAPTQRAEVFLARHYSHINITSKLNTLYASPISLITQQLEISIVHSILNVYQISSANFQSPSGRIASETLSNIFARSIRSASMRSLANSCVDGMSVRQKPGGERARSYACLCLPN